MNRNRANTYSGSCGSRGDGRSATLQVDVIDDVAGYISPANGAVGVALEPWIDAGDVEDMAALGEHPDELAVSDLGETDHAIDAGGAVVEDYAVAGFEFRRRDRIDGGLSTVAAEDAEDETADEVDKVQKNDGAGGSEEQDQPDLICGRGYIAVGGGAAGGG